jgi:pyruvate dehydrogenase E2 component (dihydrolipoamide acetyltransferase)
MPNLRLQKKKNMSAFRKIALGTWNTAKDPQVYGSMTVRMDEAMRYRDAFRARTGKKLQVTHMIAKVMGAVYESMPDANAILRWGNIWVREDVAVFFQVVMKDPDTGEIDLSGVTIKDPEKKSLEEICDEFLLRAEKVRQRKDKELEKTRGTFKAMPQLFVRFMLNLVSFVSYTLNLDLRWAGIPQDAFGSAMVTNIGSLGLEEAYVPVVPYSHVPLLIAIGKIKDEAIVEDGEIKPGKTMTLYATFDHRVLDGAHAAKMVTVVQEWFGNPFKHFDSIDPVALPEAGEEEPVAAQAEATADA